MKTGFFATMAAGALMATSASAVTIDFAALGAAEERVVEGETLDFGGLGVTITSNGGGLGVVDNLFQGRPGGLGVCATFNEAAGECGDNASDNVSEGETVTLSFDRVVDLSGMTFRGERHYGPDEDAGDLQSSNTLLIDGTELTFGDAAVASLSSVTSVSFGYGGGSANQFYLSALEAVDSPEVNPIPVPAAFGLFAGALGLLGAAAGRRRRG